MENNNTTNGWNVWSKAVLLAIEELKDDSKDCAVKLNTLVTEVAVLKNELAHIAKTEGETAGRKWGIITGVSTGLIVGLVMLLISHLIK